MTCSQTSTLGVYLLGALEPEERSTFESHLYRCDICRAELVRLAPLPGLLNQITTADFDYPAETALAEAPVPLAELPFPVAQPPAPAVVDSLAEPDTPRTARPRRRFWQLAAAAAMVVVLTVGGVVGYQALRGSEGSGSPEQETVTWSATNPANGARAEVQLTHRSWGTEMKVWMSNVPPGRSCQLIVHAASGYLGEKDYREVAGGWGTAHYDPHEEVPGATSIDLASISKLEFVDNNDTLVVDVQRPPTG